ncbi:MAG: extracellular solute-binding protein [Candidatus Thermoplasmatota archaeon]|nr:extracellular solute-binding protein [Candidatus Thermoplasmatota archaeon]MCL5789500.1 extracellular solute-binding protein [Candidatus Thermoplasmatota archaeon]
MRNSTLAVILIVVLLVGVGAGYTAGYFANHASSGKPHVLSVYAAGSLKYVLGDQFNPSFENITGIGAGITFGGSVSNAVQIKAGAQGDVFISAAAGVIPQYLIPNYTSWMVIFASNEMAITWTNSSYDIPSSFPFWFENITAPGVKVAASNSSLDPSGFQAIEMTKLAGILYTNWSNPYVRMAFNNDESQFLKYNHAWNSWFGPNGTLSREGNGGGYPVNDSLALYDQLFEYDWQVSHDLYITTVEIGLDNYLTTGSVDYALTYKSQAINQHLDFYENPTGGNGLTSWINLGNISEDQVKFYSEVNTSGPSESNIGNFEAGPILYAATILTISKDVGESQQFLYYLVSNLGYTDLKSSDFDPIAVPFIYSSSGSIPSFLSGITQPVPSYIPPPSYEQV